MTFFRRWLLVLSALMLGGGQLLAASREDHVYAAAIQAFDDKFYSLAENRLTQYLQIYGKSTNAPTAVLLLAQAEYYQRNYTAAVNRLAAPANVARAKVAGLADQYVYWLAEAQFANGDLEDAERNFVSLTVDYPKSSLSLNAVVEAAAALAKLGQWSEAALLLDNTEGPFQRAVRLDPANEQVSNGRLIQAEGMCRQQAFGEAIRILNLLEPALLTREQDWRRAYLLYRANLGLQNVEAALAATTNLLQIARLGHGALWATNLAVSVASHATLLEQHGLLSDATSALQENLSSGIPVGQQQQTILKLAALAIAQNNLTNAEAGLELFLTQFPESPAADAALLTIGELQLREFLAQPSATNQLAMAQTNLDRFIETYTNSPLTGKAYLTRGWCHWLKQEYPESLDDFQAAAQALPASEDLAVARFKVGDAQFAMMNFSGATTNYQAALETLAALSQMTNSLASRAWYQILRSQLAQGNAAGVDEAMRQLLEKFSTSTSAESSLLLAGEGFSDFDSPAKAREVFRRFEADRTNSALLPDVAFAVARTFERETNWTAAATNYQTWLERYPTNGLRPLVEYARNWAVAQTGDEAGAFKLFTQYPTNAVRTPLAYWWIAAHYFQLGGTNLTMAELYYLHICQDFPTNGLAKELAYPARLMAGRAAMGRGSYRSAIRNYWDPLVGDSNCPPDLQMQARFAYCEALWHVPDTNNLYLQTVSNLLSQIFTQYPTNEPGALAWSETGDCDLQFGALDAATNAYAQVLNFPGASQELRYRAQFGLGMVLEKKAEGLADDAQKPLLDMAMKNYQSIFDPEAETQSEFWRKKAGLQILVLNAKTGSLKGQDLDDFYLKLERIFPQLKDSLEPKRLALKN